MHTQSWCGHAGCVGLYDIVILYFWISNKYFRCVVQNSLYHNTGKGTMWQCALVSCTPSQALGQVFGCVLFRCWMSLCSFFNSLIKCYVLMMIAKIIGILWPFYSFWTTHLGFLWLGSPGSVTKHLPGCFCPWAFSLNIGLNILPLDSFMSCLDPLLGYSTEQFQTLQPIVHVVFSAVD